MSETAAAEAAGIDMSTKPSGYKECGGGMGPALNIASSTNAYLLADRGTWLSFKNRGDLTIAKNRSRHAAAASDSLPYSSALKGAMPTRR